jgi:hypothetical protein
MLANRFDDDRCSGNSGGKKFKGGKQNSRDSFFGLNKRPGFNDFKKWWHREGKDLGELTKEEAEETWKYWVEIGKPSPK